MIDVKDIDPATMSAQLRVKRGMDYEYKAPQGQMIGRVYVGSNPMQHVAEALRGYQAIQDQNQGIQELKDIKNQRQEALVNSLRTFNDTYMGTPEKRTEVPQQVMVAGDGANDGEMAQGSITNVTPAVKANPLAAISGLASSANPMLAQAGIGMLAQFPQQREQAMQRAAERQTEREWRSQERELDRQNRADLIRLTAENRRPTGGAGGEAWKYDAGSDTWVQPPNAQFPMGRATPNVGKVAAGQNFDYLANNFVGDEKNPGIVDKTPQGGWLGIGGKLGTGTQSAKEFDNAKEQMSTELRKIFRIPGEGALSDKEQAQYGIQLPSRDNDPDLNRQIVKDLRFRVANSVNPQGVNPLQPNTPKPEGRTPKPIGPKVGDAQDGFVFMGGNPADPKSWKKQ